MVALQTSKYNLSIYKEERFGTKFSPSLKELAELIIKSTENPQSNLEQEYGRFIEPLQTDKVSQLLDLQNVLQNGNDVKTLAISKMVDIAACALAPRPNTPTGDFYKVIPLHDGRLSILVGDACGHDTPDAWANSLAFLLFTSTEKFSLEAYKSGASAVDVLKYIDQYCNFKGKGVQDFVSANHIILDLEKMSFQYASAFNTYPAVIIRSNGKIDTIHVHGGPISNPELPIEYSKWQPDLYEGQIGKGDTIILYTDGLPDGKHNSGELMEKMLPGIYTKLSCRTDLASCEILEFIRSELAVTDDDFAIAVIKIL